MADKKNNINYFIYGVYFCELCSINPRGHLPGMIFYILQSWISRKISLESIVVDLKRVDFFEALSQTVGVHHKKKNLFSFSSVIVCLPFIMPFES